MMEMFMDAFVFSVWLLPFALVWWVMALGALGGVWVKRWLCAALVARFLRTPHD